MIKLDQWTRTLMDIEDGISFDVYMKTTENSYIQRATLKKKMEKNIEKWREK